MQLTELKLSNLRCLEAAQIQPMPGINFIAGDNGSGKTTVLEAIHLLSRTRSFRGASNRRLMREGADSMTVFGRVQAAGNSAFSIGLQRQHQQLQFKLSNQPDARVLDLVRALPVQVISPGLHALLERGPTQRRRFMDWGVFHVEQEFHTVWQRYQRALRQRNAALRRGETARQVSIWDEELSLTAIRMDAYRRAHVEQLRRSMRAPPLEQVTDESTLEYLPGWPLGQAYRESLAAAYTRDARAGHTTVGPHRADLRLRWRGRDAVEMASRGEQKLLVSLLLLRQAELAGEAGRAQPLLLIDDMAAELGQAYRRQLLRAVADSGMQAFITFLEPSQIPPDWRSAALFHVKHGAVTAAQGAQTP